MYRRAAASLKSIVGPPFALRVMLVPGSDSFRWLLNSERVEETARLTTVAARVRRQQGERSWEARLCKGFVDASVSPTKIG